MGLAEQLSAPRVPSSFVPGLIVAFERPCIADGCFSSRPYSPVRRLLAPCPRRAVSLSVLGFDSDMLGSLNAGESHEGLVFTLTVGAGLFALFLLVDLFRIRKHARDGSIKGGMGQWSWAAHRVTGVGVIAFLFGHIVDTFAVGFGPELYNETISLYQQWWFKPFEVLLIGATLFHALNGMRIILFDFWPGLGPASKRRSPTSSCVLFVVGFRPRSVLHASFRLRDVSFRLMAIDRPRTERTGFAPIIEELARTSLALSDSSGRRRKEVEGRLQVENECNVRRVVQAYWTPFMAEFRVAPSALISRSRNPGFTGQRPISRRVDVNWVFCFSERPDGEIELAYYEQYHEPQRRSKDSSTWRPGTCYTATDITWDDVILQISETRASGPSTCRSIAEATTTKAVQESLKKSTIFWLRWELRGRADTMPVWFLYDSKADKIYVLSGERQQTLPGAERIRQATSSFDGRERTLRSPNPPPSCGRWIQDPSGWRSPKKSRRRDSISRDFQKKRPRAGETSA